MRKLAGVLLAAALLLGGGLHAQAAQTGGSIRIHLDAGELPVTNGAITLYQAGVPVTEGYRLMESFGGGLVRQEDVSSEYLAHWLAESVTTEGITVNLDVDGNVSFSGLEDGLYLLIQTLHMDGFHPIEPFLVAVPWNGHEEIQLYPAMQPIIADNPQTGQPFAPFLGALGLVASGVGLYLCIDAKRRK